MYQTPPPPLLQPIHIFLLQTTQRSSCHGNTSMGKSIDFDGEGAD